MGQSGVKCWFFWLSWKLWDRSFLLSALGVVCFVFFGLGCSLKPETCSVCPHSDFNMWPIVLSLSTSCTFLNKNELLFVFIDPEATPGTKTLQVEPLKDQVRSFRREKILQIPALSRLINKKRGFEDVDKCCDHKVNKLLIKLENTMVEKPVLCFKRRHKQKTTGVSLFGVFKKSEQN